MMITFLFLHFHYLFYHRIQSLYFDEKDNMMRQISIVLCCTMVVNTYSFQQQIILSNRLVLRSSRVLQEPSTRSNTSSYRKYTYSPSSSQRHVIQQLASSPSSSLSSLKEAWFRSMSSTVTALRQGTSFAVRQSWWCFPMILFLIPLISLMNGSSAQMPSWWAMSNLKHLHESKTGIALIIGFLSSNIFYFMSGLYLLNALPFMRRRNNGNGICNVNGNGNNKTSVNENRSSNQIGTINQNGIHPMLGWIVLSSGAMSLIYHTFQAVGPLNIAESLCFIDHGLALSSGLFFLDKCGLPSLKTWIIGTVSLAFLATSGDVYPIVHSLWHLGSASATISWASDGVERRRRFILKTIKEQRELIRDMWIENK